MFLFIYKILPQEAKPKKGIACSEKGLDLIVFIYFYNLVHNGNEFPGPDIRVIKVENIIKIFHFHIFTGRSRFGQTPEDAFHTRQINNFINFLKYTVQFFSDPDSFMGLNKSLPLNYHSFSY
jgi:hypothetical protein